MLRRGAEVWYIVDREDHNKTRFSAMWEPNEYMVRKYLPSQLGMSCSQGFKPLYNVFGLGFNVGVICVRILANGGEKSE